MNPAQPPLEESPHDRRPGRVAFRRLHALGRVGLRGDACLHLQRPWLGCRRCEDACPQASLTRGDGALELDPARCTACGLCASDCPTGALTVEGFVTGTVPAAAVAVVCEKAAADAAATRDAWQIRRVPCFGGLAVTDWLRLALGAAGAPLQLLDDGSCTRCPTARGGGNPGLETLAAARWALAAAGVRAGALPQRLVTGPLPNGNPRSQARPDARVGGRRAFFAGLSRALSAGVAQAVAPAARLAQGRPPTRPRDPVPNPRGDETRVLMLQLARLNGRGTPLEAWLPAIAAGDACRAHGTCTHACPTGALELEDRTDYFVLRFDAWQCISCGACARICPEQALEQRPSAWVAFAGGAVELSSTEQRTCARCGTAVAANGDADDGDGDGEPGLCDRCSKSRQLARAGFALFNPPGREPPVAPDPPWRPATSTPTTNAVTPPDQTRSQENGDT